MEKFLNRRYLVAFFLFIIGFCTSIYQNISGTAIPTGDSGSNLISSQSILDNNVHAWPSYLLEKDGSLKTIMSEKNTVWPPLTASIITSLRIFGLSQFNAVFIFTTFFAGFVLFCAYLFAFEVTNSILLSTLSTITFFSLWGFQYWISNSFMPEGLYVSITLIIALFYIKVMKSNHSLGKLLLLGLITSTTYYIKSAAPAFMMSVNIAAFLYFLKSGFFSSIKKTSAIVFGIVIGALPWLYRNILIGTIGGSGAAGHSPVLQSILSFFRLFIPYHGTYFEKVHTMVGLVLFTLLILTIGFIFIRNSSKSFSWFNFKSCLNNPPYLISLSYIFSFLIVIFIAIFIIPKASHIEMRYWLEIYPFIVPFVLSILANRFYTYSLKIKKQIKVLSIILFTLIVVFNLTETHRNFSKDWTILRTQEVQMQFRNKLCKLFPNKTITYFSNYGNELFVQSGLSYWDTRGIIPNDSNNVQVFLSFKPSNNVLMTLSKISEPPVGWEKFGEVNNFDVYIEQKNGDK